MKVNDQPPVRAAIVGLGKFAHSLAKACLASECIDIVACQTRTAAKAAAFAETYGCKAYTSYDELLSDDNVEAVILVTPNNLHAGQTIAAAAAGKHVFVEKPVCNTLDEADAMIAATTEAGRLLAVGYQERRRSTYRHIKKLIETGALGRIHAFEANHCGNLLAIWPPDDWRFTKEGGIGPILHKGSHKIDVLNYLFGAAETVATIGAPLDFNPEVDATTVSAIRFANGIVGSLSTGFAHTNASLNVFGVDRSVFFSGYGTVIKIKDEKEWTFETVDCGPDRPVIEELSEFAGAIRGRGKIEVDGVAGRNALRLALALHEAGLTGLTQRLSQPGDHTER